jgi:hypothetical protein
MRICWDNPISTLPLLLFIVYLSYLQHTGTIDVIVWVSTIKLCFSNGMDWALSVVGIIFNFVLFCNSIRLSVVNEVNSWIFILGNFTFSLLFHFFTSFSLFYFFTSFSLFHFFFTFFQFFIFFFHFFTFSLFHISFQFFHTESSSIWVLCARSTLAFSFWFFNALFGKFKLHEIVRLKVAVVPSVLILSFANLYPQYLSYVVTFSIIW